MKKSEVVVVTGASAGLGRAIACAFARSGAHLGLLARGRAGLVGAGRDVERLGGKALMIPTDVADPDQVEAAATAIEEHLGPVDAAAQPRSIPSSVPFRAPLVGGTGAEEPASSAPPED